LHVYLIAIGKCTHDHYGSGCIFQLPTASFIFIATPTGADEGCRERASAYHRTGGRLKGAGGELAGTSLLTCSEKRGRRGEEEDEPSGQLLEAQIQLQVELATLGYLLVVVAVVVLAREVADAGVHALGLVLELLDLVARAAEERTLFGEDVGELAKEYPHGAFGGAHRDGFHGRPSRFPPHLLRCARSRDTRRGESPATADDCAVCAALPPYSYIICRGQLAAALF